MDEIQADKPTLSDDRIQDRPADEDNPFRPDESVPLPEPDGFWKGTLKAVAFRSVVYTLLGVGFWFMAVPPRYSNNRLFSILCFLGTILFGIIGWLSTSGSLRRSPPNQWGSTDDNPFRKRENRTAVGAVGVIAVIIWSLVLIGVVGRLLES